MLVQINTDHNISGDEAAADQMRVAVEEALRRVSTHVTRVEVHLSDQDGPTKDAGPAIRCLMEARLEGREPVAVTDVALTADKAVDGAAAKLSRSIETTLGRVRDQRAGRHRD